MQSKDSVKIIKRNIQFNKVPASLKDEKSFKFNEKKSQASSLLDSSNFSSENDINSRI
jgi:hypothetical protein